MPGEEWASPCSLSVCERFRRGHKARLANALADMGLKKGDRFAALAYNCVEWMDLYAAAAKGGFILVHISSEFGGLKNRFS